MHPSQNGEGLIFRKVAGKGEDGAHWGAESGPTSSERGELEAQWL